MSEDEIKKVRAAEIEGLSWDKYDKALQTRMEDADVLVVEGRTWEARLEIYGRGDFDADAVEDLLVKVSGSMKEGTYQSTRLLMLSRTSDDAVLKVSREFPVAAGDGRWRFIPWTKSNGSQRCQEFSPLLALRRFAKNDSR